MSHNELQKLQQQLRKEIQSHQILVVKVQTDPNNAQLKKSIQEQQKRITSLSEKQKKVVEQLRSQLGVKKIPSHHEKKISNTTPLGASQHLNIPTRPVMKGNMKTVQGAGHGPADTSPPLTPPRMSILTNKPTTLTIKVPQITCRIAPMESKVSYPKEQQTTEVVKKRPVSSSEAHKHKRALTAEERKLEFMAAVGLITQRTLEHLQNKRQERKRRSTANPQFSSYNRKELESQQSASKYIEATSASNWVDESAKKARLSEPEPVRSKPAGKKPSENTTVIVNGKSSNHNSQCAVCKKNYGNLVSCGTCHLTYHLGCLDPPLLCFPVGVWSCHQCKASYHVDQWEDTLAVVHSYLGHKSRKEEEKKKLVKRAADLRKERLALEERVKQLNTAITKKKTASEDLMASYRRTEDAVDRIKEFITLIQS